MRMPILSYFLVVGIVLFGGLILVSSQLESKPLPVSQRKRRGFTAESNVRD